LLGALALAVALCGCAPADAFTESVGCSTGLQVHAEGLGFDQTCLHISFRLRPEVRIGGAWRGAGRDGPCTHTDALMSCPAGPAGSVEAFVEKFAWKTRFVAAQDAEVEGLGFYGEASLPSPKAWMSHGFQSWSMSGVLALSPPPDDASLDKALATRGDTETLRAGTQLSWWYGWAGDADAALFFAAETWERFKPWVQFHTTDKAGTLRVRAAAGGTGERVAVPKGGSLPGESFRALVTDGPNSAFFTFASNYLPTRRKTYSAHPEAGWNSWYELWANVAAKDVTDNALLAKGILAPNLPKNIGKLRIVVDDGWELGWGDWEPNAKFPDGLDGLAKKLKDQGYSMGVWLAPLLAHESSATFKAHPDWFLLDAVYNNINTGSHRVLDVTHPEAAAHLKGTIAKLVGWGYDFLKIDFLFAGTFESQQRHTPMTGMQAYTLALLLIREAAGEDVVLLAVGAPGPPSFPFVDAWRSGMDIAGPMPGPHWIMVGNQARMLGARWALCQGVTLCDPDPPLLRALPREEVETGAWIVALAGGGLFVSDDLRALDPARTKWGLDPQRAAFALGGVGARPWDAVPATPPQTLVHPLFDIVADTDSQVFPELWGLPSGERLRLNRTTSPVTVEGVTIPPHGARVLPPLEP